MTAASPSKYFPEKSASTEEREEFFKQTKKLPAGNSGTPYNVATKAIALTYEPSLEFIHLGSAKSYFGATIDVVKWNAQTSSEVSGDVSNAMKRLQKLFVYGLKGQALGADLLFKTFADLDLVFFAGQLYGKVLWRWKDFNPNPSLPFSAVIWGQFQILSPGPHQMAVVQLDSGAIAHSSRYHPLHQMFSVMFHKMTHIYLGTMCYKEDYRRRLEGLNTHDLWWRSIRWAVHQRALDLFAKELIDDDDRILIQQGVWELKHLERKALEGWK